MSGEMETFEDTHDLALSNKSNISDLVSKCTAVKVMNSLNYDMNIEGTFVVEFKHNQAEMDLCKSFKFFSESIRSRYYYFHYEALVRNP